MTASPFPGSSPVLKAGGGFRLNKRVGIVVGVLVVLIILALALLLRPPSQPFAGTGVPTTSKIEPTKTYQNPFDREAQYANPFAEFKSPFQSLQQ